ncbi:MAG: hypothetical protein CLLPBCKN_007587 [Chroococcidiopsis cubana SAG 39.79]|uniref:Uncharacterized protein n=1 Tax=Chroococcidiopsis cubana SAG 39.79 TaxID=388085 RepID=A0AB37UT29_9CYAN|nr:hypothetical protein [Chroococcidiopsis cubana]MDZ4878152.1 hypothetical protein [Chroococcidiopsis cubana SAG 39.79]PSB63670.1 hypothetical protein C7B79_12980 [Chroococcidiopsis cubana CCALA 043]RUT14581.1 hypothetical protein DSM107010_01270 [Chroococcidiopsis cubana SAG 39.79]
MEKAYNDPNCSSLVATADPIAEPDINTTTKQPTTSYTRSHGKRYRYLLTLGFVAAIALHALKAGAATPEEAIVVANANPSNSSFPTRYYSGVPVPDWNEITFKNMVFSEAGGTELPNIKSRGMKAIRIWQAGQSVADVMELGDFEASEFGIEELSVRNIASMTGVNLKTLKLDSLELTKWQTIADLTEAIPGLGKLRVADVPPIRDLVAKLARSYALDNQTIANLLETYPILRNVELGKYINLGNYKLTDIPGLTDAALQKFANWQNNIIGKVPGLALLPFSKFPGIPAADLTAVGKVDLPLGTLESDRHRSISGSDREGFNVSCDSKCTHIELAGSGELTGAQWISGKSQKVRGGFGVLGNLFNHKEPTGRHPFGKSFKQVIWNVNEANGSITTTMFFRICKRGIPDLGCSPYGIGPVQFLNYKEMDAILLGRPLSVPR